MEITATIKAQYTREIPSLIDSDGSILAVHVVPVIEYISGTLTEISRRYESIRAIHPGASFEVIS